MALSHHHRVRATLGRALDLVAAQDTSVLDSINRKSLEQDCIGQYRTHYRTQRGRLLLRAPRVGGGGGNTGGHIVHRVHHLHTLAPRSVRCSGRARRFATGRTLDCSLHARTTFLSPRR
eukprot:3046758-Rhodomonas_salina.5